MDSQLYEVLKNGKPTGVIGDMELVVHVIRHLEAMIDRATQHSPYTIGKKNG
jgi:hypothetical protein